MGSCLSCQSVPSSPMVAMKWNFSTITSFRHSSEDMVLHRDRYFLNRPAEIASHFSQQGKKAMLASERFGDGTTTTFTGGNNELRSRTEDVTAFCDGHMVAKRVRDFLPPELSEHWKSRFLRYLFSYSFHCPLHFGMVRYTFFAARAVVNLASGECLRKYGLSKADAVDCPVVCLFLNSPQERMTRRHVCSRPEQFVERLWP
ncbi:hypothetical protein AAHA92_30155 [Salvia divinorum]|uniref:Uncharacterized protein n=1 Tax=Salvia divinorum TaxID=28513 RepID=A0ABD1G0N8_SALDI